MVRSQHLWCLLYAIFKEHRGGGGICDVRYPGVCSSSMYARCYPMWLILESLTPGLRFSNSRLFCEFVPIVRRNLCATAVHPSYRLHSTTVSIPSRFYRQQQQLDTLNLTEIVYETCIQMQRSQEKMWHNGRTKGLKLRINPLKHVDVTQRNGNWGCIMGHYIW